MPYANSADHPASVSLAGVSERTIALQRVMRPLQVLRPPRSRTLVQPSQARTRFFISPRLLYKAYLSLSRFKIRVGGVRPNYLISGWKIHTHGIAPAFDLQLDKLNLKLLLSWLSSYQIGCIPLEYGHDYPVTACINGSTSPIAS